VTYSLNTANRIGVRYWAVLDIGTQYNFEYDDDEPGGYVLSDSTILGTVTGVPKLGSAMYMAFVNEEVNATWFGSTDTPTDWGDGGGGGMTHTYSAVGSYWVSIGSPAQAVRRIVVIYRTKPEGEYSPGNISYPIEIDRSTEGNINTGFSLKCTLHLDSLSELEATYGVLYNRTMVGIFCQEYRNGEAFGNITLVTGGWIESPSIAKEAGQRTIQFICYGPNYWLLNQYNREMYFIDPTVMKQAFALDGANQFKGNDALNYDILGSGYVPNHFLKCDCTICAMHLLGHVRVYASAGDTPGTAINPSLQGPSEVTAYGTIGQFWDVDVDSDFDENAGVDSAGFTDYSINNGQLLSNVKQTIDNEGYRYYDRHDLKQRYERRPYYLNTPRTPVMDITDITKLLSGYPDSYRPTRSQQKNVKAVIVEKPPLAVISDANQATGGWHVTFSALGLVCAQNGSDPTTQKCGSPNDVDMQTALWNVWNEALQAGTFGGNSQIFDPLNQSLNTSGTDPFYAIYPNPVRSFGQTIGPLKYIFTLSPQDYAQGRDKEERASWTITVPIGQVLGPGLGDTITITDATTELNYDWTAKSFDVVGQRMMLDKDRLLQVLQVIECDPDE